MGCVIAVPLKGIEEIYTGITSMSIMLIYQFRRLRRQLHGRGKAVVIVYAILHIALLLCRQFVELAKQRITLSYSKPTRCGQH
jgi:hypothetical protein